MKNISTKQETIQFLQKRFEDVASPTIKTEDEFAKFLQSYYGLGKEESIELSARAEVYLAKH